MKNKLSAVSRGLLVLAAIGMVLVIFTPIWRIELDAPQYPEGLHLSIHANGLRGNVDIINGLNHYIGMKTLHNEDFFEFTILPYCIVFFALLFMAVALLNSRRWLNLAFILFVAFGVIAMVDFWKWEYNYGHNLNPDAAIIVPGMAYQPPLIGFKQLLNFGAYSIPDTGGWIFIGAGLLLLFLVVMEWRTAKKQARLSGAYRPAAAIAFIFFASSCSSAPVAIVVGKDNCSFCKMTVSDPRFGAELITKKGKIYKFDDTHCLLSFLQSKEFDKTQAEKFYFTDFSDQHTLIKAEDALFLKADALKSPMGGNIAVFSNSSRLQEVQQQYKGTVLHWNELQQP